MYDGDVLVVVAHDPLGHHRERGFLDDHQTKPALRDKQSLALVVQSTLLTATDAGDGLPTVEERRGLGVLFLLELDDQVEIGPVAVDGELRTEWA